MYKWKIDWGRLVVRVTLSLYFPAMLTRALTTLKMCHASKDADHEPIVRYHRHHSEPSYLEILDPSVLPSLDNILSEYTLDNRFSRRPLNASLSRFFDHGEEETRSPKETY
jgi:hypothetical protein